MPNDRLLRRVLIAAASGGLILGLAAWSTGRHDWARWCWAAGTIPVIAGLLVSMIRDLLSGRLGVDAVAFVSMLGALALGQELAGIVIAIMYAGGNVLEDFAVARAEHDLRSLIDRAPRIAHRRSDSLVADVPIEKVAVGDQILVQAGEIVPVDGFIVSQGAVIDEAALTGEPIPASRQAGEPARSGTLNVGRRIRNSRVRCRERKHLCGHCPHGQRGANGKVAFHPNGRSLCPAVAAGHSGRLPAARGSCPAIRCADWLCWSRRHPARLFWRHPSLSLPAFARAAKHGILIKGSGPLEALARIRTVMFDKTGTLTVGGARLVAIEAAPGENADEVLRIAASLEQASHHVVAAAILDAARARELKLGDSVARARNHWRRRRGRDRRASG